MTDLIDKLNALEGKTPDEIASALEPKPDYAFQFFADTFRITDEVIRAELNFDTQWIPIPEPRPDRGAPVRTDNVYSGGAYSLGSAVSSERSQSLDRATLTAWRRVLRPL